MLLNATVHVSHPDIVFSPTTGSVPDATIRTECRLDAPDDSPVFYHVSGADPGTIESALVSDHTVTDADRLAGRNGQYTYRVTVSHETESLTQLANELGIRLLHAQTDDAGWELRLQAADRRTLSLFRERCRERGISFHVDRIRRAETTHEGRPVLTDDQRDTLLSAYERGYFDVPRSASQEDLARDLDVSGSAVSQRLRRAVAQLVASTLPVE